MSCQTAACKNEENDWAKLDTNCISRGGKCQFNTLTCSGGGKDYHTSSGFECGGPSERQCCAPNALPPTPSPTPPPIPTVPDIPAPITPSGGNDSGKTAGIVIGVLFAICAVLGLGYYVNQNGVPFIAQQQSFGNVNSANNNDGVTDGISNPLDANDDDDDNDDDGAAVVEPVEVVPVASVAPVIEPVIDDMFAPSEPANDGLVAVDMSGGSTETNDNGFDSLI